MASESLQGVQIGTKHLKHWHLKRRFKLTRFLRV